MAPAIRVNRGVRPEVHVVSDPDALTRTAAEEIARAADAAVAKRGRFLIALSGGSTPARLYALLASDAFAGRLEWSCVHVCWGDERCVPPDDPASNYGMARRALLDRVPLPAANVHRMRGEEVPAQAAVAYASELRTLAADAAVAPRFDLVLLGLGADGHTASLFPGTAAVRERQRWVVAHAVAAEPAWRITLSPVVINAAAEVLFLVSGADKATALRRVLEEPRQPDLLPAQVIAPESGRLLWLVDGPAASLLTR
jgi:6-phosphogluconolactonase